MVSDVSLLSTATTARFASRALTGGPAAATSAASKAGDAATAAAPPAPQELPQATQTGKTTARGGNVALYGSPWLSFDNQAKLTVIEFRNVETGEVKVQYPPKQVVDLYRRNGSQSQTGTVPAGSEAAVKETASTESRGSPANGPANRDDSGSNGTASVTGRNGTGAGTVPDTKPAAPAGNTPGNNGTAASQSGQPGTGGTGRGGEAPATVTPNPAQPVPRTAAAATGTAETPRLRITA